MKIVASILAMYFGLLIVQPFTSMGSDIIAKPAKACMADKCCKKAAPQKETTPNKSPTACNTDLCNPFMPCGISIVHRMVQVDFANPVLDLLKNKKPTIDEDIVFDYLADCWRPPELS